jgi:hypothetical protein
MTHEDRPHRYRMPGSFSPTRSESLETTLMTSLPCVASSYATWLELQRNLKQPINFAADVAFPVLSLTSSFVATACQKSTVFLQTAKIVRADSKFTRCYFLFSCWLLNIASGISSQYGSCTTTANRARNLHITMELWNYIAESCILQASV